MYSKLTFSIKPLLKFQKCGTPKSKKRKNLAHGAETRFNTRRMLAAAAASTRKHSESLTILLLASCALVVLNGWRNGGNRISFDSLWSSWQHNQACTHIVLTVLIKAVIQESLADDWGRHASLWVTERAKKKKGKIEWENVFEVGCHNQLHRKMWMKLFGTYL